MYLTLYKKNSIHNSVWFGFWVACSKKLFFSGNPKKLDFWGQFIKILGRSKHGPFKSTDIDPSSYVDVMASLQTPWIKQKNKLLATNKITQS